MGNKTLARLILAALAIILIAVPTVQLTNDPFVYATQIGIFFAFSAIMLFANNRLHWQVVFGFLGAIAVGVVVGALSPETALGRMAFLSAFLAVANEAINEMLFNGLTAKEATEVEETETEDLVVVDSAGQEVVTAEQLVAALQAYTPEQLYKWACGVNPGFEAEVEKVINSASPIIVNAADGTPHLVTLMNQAMNITGSNGEKLNPAGLRWLFDRMNNMLLNPKQTPAKVVAQALEKAIEAYPTLPADKQKVKPESAFAEAA
jgi:hypothetical protein